MATILVVEDEPAILEILSDLFESEGYLVLVATDGLEALAILARERPDLILTDHMLPFVDGAQLARAVRERADIASVPILMMSAVPTPPRAAIDDFIRKPFNLDDLAWRVAQHLRRGTDSSRARR